MTFYAVYAAQPQLKNIKLVFSNLHNDKAGFA